MEFNEYQRYREQQIQSDAIASDALETSVATTKNHNPITAAAALHGREQLPIELRQRVCIAYFPYLSFKPCTNKRISSKYFYLGLDQPTMFVAQECPGWNVLWQQQLLCASI